jgi:hypothetical protein
VFLLTTYDERQKQQQHQVEQHSRWNKGSVLIHVRLHTYMKCRIHIDRIALPAECTDRMSDIFHCVSRLSAADRNCAQNRIAVLKILEQNSENYKLHTRSSVWHAEDIFVCLLSLRLETTFK